MAIRAIEPSYVKFQWRAPHKTIYGHKKMCLEQNISIGSFHASFHNFHNHFYIMSPFCGATDSPNVTSDLGFKASSPMCNGFLRLMSDATNLLTSWRPAWLWCRLVHIFADVCRHLCALIGRKFASHSQIGTIYIWDKYLTKRKC